MVASTIPATLKEQAVCVAASPHTPSPKFAGVLGFGWHIQEMGQLGPVFEGIVDVMGAVVDAVTWLLEQFNKLSDWLESNGIEFRRWVGRIIGVVSALGLLAAGIRLVLSFLRPCAKRRGQCKVFVEACYRNL